MGKQSDGKDSGIKEGTIKKLDCITRTHTFQLQISLSLVCRVDILNM